MTSTTDPFLPGFQRDVITVDGTEIACWSGGHGQAVLLLHGYPETHVMWRSVAPRLAERYRVVCPDLRGYGDSAKPAGTATHETYSKREMAHDQIGVMRVLGHDTFAVVGHDRGARVALRLALDHPEEVTALAVLDIVPTTDMYTVVNRRRATAAWRYFFLVQPYDLPERLIGADRDRYLEWTLAEWCGTDGALPEAVLGEYRRCFTPATVHATCEDYRAGASVDLEHDRADADANLACPTLVLWSRHGLGALYDVLGIWRRRAPVLHGRGLDCGHFLAEERPDEVTEALDDFLTG